ncbi:MAG: hypothetical protein GQ536_03800 [Candidatus Aminicenantes bacterium]|nr:hypothetical protein [Candidatus Aminicenantes bacterium]
MKIEDRYFRKFEFTKEQIKKNLNNAVKDLTIAKKVKILEVKFNYAYTSLIKAGLTLLSYYQMKVKSIPGHHIKIIEKLAQILKDNDIEDIGNIMRSKRNLDFYAGGIEVTEKECREYINFVEEVLTKVKEAISLIYS